jgi:formylglycine-generating enzyme required for sulfatase activity
VEKLGTLNKFVADILDIVDGSYIDGHEEMYTNFAQGFELMPKIAAQLSGQAAGPGSTSANFVRIEGGTFTMGSPSNEPGRRGSEAQRRVTVSAFYMGKYEVTQAEYEAVMGTNPSYFKGANLPVERVSWYDAAEYCNRLSQKEGLTPAYTIDKGRSDPNNTNSDDTVRWLVTWNANANGYRLPTEAEWEYACRAGTTTPFNTGNNITTGNANYDGNNPYDNNAKGTYRERTTPAGSFAPNPWGLYDMHGNVWEWCWDWYEYTSGMQTNPRGAVSGANRVQRGGGWGSSAALVRSAYRGHYTPSNRIYNLGFRLVRS